MIQINFIGRVVADAQVKTSKQGRQYIDMRMAADMKTGENPETMWIRVVSFTTPVAMAQYYTKGKPLYVTGRYEQSTYDTKDGRTLINNDVLASSIEFIGLGRDDKAAQVAESKAQPQSNGGSTQLRNPSTQTNIAEAPKSAPAPAPMPVEEAPDDDLPF